MFYKNMILFGMLLSWVVMPMQAMESQKASWSLPNVAMLGGAFLAGVAATYFVWVRPKNKELNFFRAEAQEGRLFFDQKYGRDMNEYIKIAGLNHLYKATKTNFWLGVNAIDTTTHFFKIEKM